MAVSRLERIVVNAGLGPWLENKDMQERIKQDIAVIAGQMPVFTLSKKAISGFKLRQGQRVGLKTTLRGKRMYDFLERLIVAALPRVKDFRGIPQGNFNNVGNLDIGIKEQVAFPEVDSEKIDYSFGMQISIVTTTNNREEGIELMKMLGLPIRFDDDSGVVEHLKTKQEEAKERELRQKKEERKEKV